MPEAMKWAAREAYRVALDDAGGLDEAATERLCNG